MFSLTSVLLCFCVIHSEIIKLTVQNFNEQIKTKPIIFVNFYADWCPHCRHFEPTFNSLEDEVMKSEIASVVALATVDSVAEPQLIEKFGITRYPSLYIFKNGIITKSQFFGARKIPQLMEFLRSAYPIIRTIHSDSDLNNKKFAIFAYNGMLDGQLYNDFSKLHQVYFEKCQFYKHNGQAHDINADTLKVLFHTKKPYAVHDVYDYKAGQYVEFDEWIKSRCVPFVQQITMENAASITSDAKPLIAVVYSNDKSSDLQKINSQLNNLKKELEGKIPVFAEADEFTYILNRVGKTIDDTPFVILDDMMHVFYLGPVSILESSQNFTAVMEAHKSGQLVETNVFPNLYIEIVQGGNHVIHINRVISTENKPSSGVQNRVEFNKESVGEGPKAIIKEKPREAINPQIMVTPKKSHEFDGNFNKETTNPSLIKSLFKSLMPDSNSFTFAKQDEL